VETSSAIAGLMTTMRLFKHAPMPGTGLWNCPPRSLPLPPEPGHRSKFSGAGITRPTCRTTAMIRNARGRCWPIYYLDGTDHAACDQTLPAFVLARERSYRPRVTDVSLDRECHTLPHWSGDPRHQPRIQDNNPIDLIRVLVREGRTFGGPCLARDDSWRRPCLTCISLTGLSSPGTQQGAHFGSSTRCER
jgi:hypothetical protein